MSTNLSVAVDLMAIANNWQTLQRQLSDCECGAVVKANAYGLGMCEVTSALYRAGCRSYFVANHHEAMVLRSELAANTRIYVLQGVEAGCEAIFADYSLTPVLISRAMVERWLSFLTQQQLSLPSVVKINTGMNRLGLNPDEFKALLPNLAPVFQHRDAMLLSHLACADEPAHSLNAEQQACFATLFALVNEVFPHVRGSLANSSGIFLGEDFHYQLARPGAALYGINPTPLGDNPMQPVVKLSLPILQVRKAAANAVVGYGAETRLARESVLAIVAGGYADGILRAFFSQMQGCVNGHQVPLVGRVSMDTLIFDVTDAGEVVEGNEIEILGPNLTLDAQAKASGTIGYELLTRLGDRVTRRYQPLDARKLKDDGGSTCG